MKALAAMKRVVDYNMKVRVAADGVSIERANMKMSMNPFDEITVEEALRLRENGKVSEILAVTSYPPVARETLRTATTYASESRSCRAERSPALGRAA